MNGTQFMQYKFTLPASSNTAQEKWDAAFLTAKQFRDKYGYDKPDGTNN